MKILLKDNNSKKFKMYSIADYAMKRYIEVLINQGSKERVVAKIRELGIFVGDFIEKDKYHIDADVILSEKKAHREVNVRI